MRTRSCVDALHRKVHENRVSILTVYHQVSMENGLLNTHTRDRRACEGR